VPIISLNSFPPLSRRKGAIVKNQRPIDSNERLLRKIFGESYRHRSDEELHQLVQDLIDSDHRLLVELNLTAWHEAHMLNAEKKI
jgi:hypothetical protein